MKTFFFSSYFSIQTAKYLLMYSTTTSISKENYAPKTVASEKKSCKQIIFKNYGEQIQLISEFKFKDKT